MNIATQPKLIYIAILVALSGTSTSVVFASDKTAKKYTNSATYNTNSATYNFNIAPTSLEKALVQFTEQSNIQFIAPSELILNKKSVGLQGRYNATEGLTRLLLGTGLNAKFISEGTYALTVTGADQRLLDAVRVEGSNQDGSNNLYLGGINSSDLSSLTGANGSRDLTATEGNNSYAQGNATVGGNRPISAQKVTQTVSVVGQQELQDKKIISLRDALQNATGVYSLGANNAVQNGSFYTRGHVIESFTTDGVSSKNNISPNSFGSEMALYDHVEVLRGGDAFTGSVNSANPSASINLVRKKPLEHPQTTFEVSAGSWDHYRQVLDTTGPLNLKGTLRGRFIVSNDLNKNFWNNGDASKQVLNGQLEYDFSPKTTLNLGVSGGYAKLKPWSTNLYTDDSFEFSRNFSPAFPGNKDETKTAGINFTLDHQFNKEWSFKLQGNKDWADVESNIIGINVSSRSSNLRDRYINGYFYYYPYMGTISSSSEGIVASVLGNFNIGGYDQGVEFSTTYSGDKSKDYSKRGEDESERFYFSDFRNVDFGSIHPSSMNLVELYSSTSDYKTYSAYLKLDIQPLRGLHILTGPRWTRMQPRWVEAGANETEDNINIPSIAIRYDLNNNISVYTSYNNLFQYMDNYLTRNSKPLDPIEGNSQEIGIKFNNDDKNLTATLALFKSKLKNSVASDDVESPDYTGTIYWKNQSYQELNKGLDFSLEGKVTPYWQTSIGYAYTKKKYKQEPGTEHALVSDIPWHVKFSNQFKLSGNDILNRIVLGSSTAFVSARNEQVYMSKPKSKNRLDRDIISLKVKPYAVTDLFARYQITDNWNVQFNVNNVFDKKYTHASFPKSSGRNFYGTPLNYLFTLQRKF